MKRDVTALPLGEGTETGSERSGLANPCPGRPEQADDSRIAVSPSPDRSATALTFEDGTTLHEAATAIAETLASALHHENIGREIRGWREVREAFALTKQLISETRPEPADG